MPFEYSKENLSFGQHKLQRLFEALPGLISWSILLGMLGLTVISPVAASVLSIAFIFYWFLRLLYTTIFLVISFIKLAVENKTSWIDHIKKITVNPKIPGPNFEDICHVVILPVAKEPHDVIAPAIKALARQTFPVKRIMVFFALEQSAPPQTRTDVENLVREFNNTFQDFQVVIHPAGVPGEARVKGANATHAAKHAAQVLREQNIDFANVLVSCFDADTVVDPQYFACLTYYFLTTPHKTRASYQPIPVYNNNIWNVPGFSRVMEIGSSFFQLVEATNPEKLVTFSSHSMSFKSLVEIGYWPVDMISDDSAIFWKAYLFYEGDYKVVPMSITVSMDATVAKNWWQTFKNIYKQRRRWAYGVENFPILMRGFIAAENIPFGLKLRHLFKMLEGHVSWATWGFLLTTLGWLPALLAGKEFHKTTIYYNEPHIALTIYRLSSISLIISVILSIVLLPRTGSKWGWLKKTAHVLEWLIMPFVIVFLSALPALDAQTRLMFGKYMEFWVTDKSRSKTEK